MLFQDRKEAAGLLALNLAAYRGSRPLVLGIPRGGVVMARVIADELGGDLDVVLVRKLRAPDQPELAIGSVTESGSVSLSDRPFLRDLPREYIDAEKEMALALLRRQRAIFTPSRGPVGTKGRIVIVVDDGIATGATVEAALRALRGAAPARLVVAAAVAPPETVESLKAKADEVVCLAQPDDFTSVSRFFLDFSEVSDDEVVSALRRVEARRAG